MACRREEIGNPFMDGIIHAAGRAVEFSFEDLLLVLVVNREGKISLADWTAENIHQ
jgi:hypothetical protein